MLCCFFYMLFLFFFFKQKTAYEMRISDWSSDVCSSDLVSSKDALNARRPHMEALFAKLGKAGIARDSLYLAWDFTVASERNISERALHIRDEIGRASCRERVCQYV